jgi:hypothetical protein
MTVTVTWPDTLPLPTFGGYGVEPVDSILRTEMESGPARQRRRYTQTPTRMPVRWRFTAWEFALFESWFKHKAKEGGEWFSINLLGGLGMVPHEARFVGRGSSPYRATPTRGGPGDGARWVVTSALEVRERPVLDEGALEVGLSEDVAGFLAACNSFNSLVNQTLSQNGW